MKIHSKENLYGEYTVPSDKSITSRAIMLGSIAKGKTYIVNPLMCTDAQTMISCVKKFGAKVKLKGRILEIKSAKKIRSGQKYDCGNSATALRLLCGVLAGSRVNAVLSGDKSLNKRSMTSIKDPLESMGLTVALMRYSYPPVLLEQPRDGRGIKPFESFVPIKSSQAKSAILLCALQGGVSARIQESIPSRNHTEILLKEMGAKISKDENTGEIILEESEILGKKLYVCGDFSVAANFIALGLLCGKTVCKNVGINPTRIALLKILNRMGANIQLVNKRILCGENIADIIATKSNLTSTHVTGEEVFHIIDELPILAVLMGMAEGESIISDLGKVQYKDADRLEMIDEMLKAIGGSSHKFEGGLVIKGVSRYLGGEVTTYSDPRIAMSAIVALTASLNGGEIDDDYCISASFPGFLECLRQNAFVNIGLANGKIGNEIHSFCMSKMNLKNYTYSGLRIKEGGVKKLISEAREYDGITYTSPYKGEGFRRVSKLVDNAKKVRSVTVTKGNYGFITDGKGIVFAMKNKGIELSGKKVLVVGCGTVGRSVICELLEEKAIVDVYNRTAKTAHDYQKKISAITVKDYISDEFVYDIIINTTPVGSGYNNSNLAISENVISKCKVAVDVAINEAGTPFLTFASQNGAITVEGEEILFFTNYISDCLLLKREVSESEAREIYKEYFNC